MYGIGTVLNLLRIFELDFGSFATGVINGLIDGYLFVVLYSLYDNYEHGNQSNYNSDYQAIDQMNKAPMTMQQPYQPAPMGQYQTQPMGQQISGQPMNQMGGQPMQSNINMPPY